MSLLGSRRFLGDYLGVGNKGGPGEMIRNGANINSKLESIISDKRQLTSYCRL
jgi:myosin-1